MLVMIDNFDSFTYNLFQYLIAAGGGSPASPATTASPWPSWRS